MTRRQMTWLHAGCRATQWGMVLLASWIVVGSVLWREPPEPPRLFVKEHHATTNAGQRADVTLDQLSSIWKRDYHQQLIEPPPPAKPKAPPKPPPKPPEKLPRLLATFVEEGESWGVFQTLKNEQRVRRATTSVGDFEVVDVQPGMATLSRNSRTYDVTVPKKRRPSGRGARKRTRR